MSELNKEDAAEHGIDVETEIEIDDIEEGDTLAVRQVSQTGDDRWMLSTVENVVAGGYSAKVEFEEGRSFVGENDLNEDAFLPGEFEG